MYPTARKFADQACDSHGSEATIEGLSEGTKTTDDAAATIGCDVTQIIKSTVMCTDDETVVALTSGTNRVDEASLGSELDAK